MTTLYEPAISENAPQDDWGISKNLSSIEVSRGAANPRTLEDLIKLRTKFVTLIGWFEPLNADGTEFIDGDRYDNDERTVHIADRNIDDGRLKTGLRLTQVDSVEDSLSYSMFEDNDEMIHGLTTHVSVDEYGGVYRTIDDLNEAGKNGNLYDLTRLVNAFNKTMTLEQIQDSMVKIFAYGAAVTSPDRTADAKAHYQNLHNVRWVFTSTEFLVDQMTKMGLEYEVITHARISEKDTQDSYFCTVKPMQALRSGIERPEGREVTRDSGHAGFKAAARDMRPQIQR